MFQLRNRKTAVAALAATALAGTGLVGVVASADAAAKTATVQNLRTGAHSTFDRVVIDYTGKKPTVKLSLVNSLYSCGKGDKLTIPGDKILKIDLTPAQAHNDKGKSTYSGPGRLSTANYNLSTLKGVRMACDFEGHVTFGVGVKNLKSYSVSHLTNPKRVVVDLKR
ncbi:AMIN-like domain-containing (lipo)protein [Sporichthya polymorpha]|uniref:AMIN-like domain-containing (lipo)protein n=1 Tax=Sporichthya polymorpha TaxID=35751 RepID=UPI0003AAF80A|nr:hypothetical protein [Sporichthya polymorpha]